MTVRPTTINEHPNSDLIVPPCHAGAACRIRTRRTRAAAP
jgi:hypothetical protein